MNRCEWTARLTPPLALYAVGQCDRKAERILPGADMLGQTKIYTSGGAEGDIPQIAMMTNAGTFKTLVKITNVGNHEIEGVQTKNGNVYFTIVTDPVNKKIRKSVLRSGQHI